MQVVLSRDNASVPWGFRLKGGAEYNVPLSILKVNEGSPSHYKIECGDIIASIGNYPALNLRHEEALNIIRMFDLTLPLVIQRQQAFAFNPTRISTKSIVTPVLWRPPSASNYEPPQVSPNSYTFAAPNSPRTQSSFANEAYTSYASPNDISQKSYQPQVTQPQVYQTPLSPNYQSYQQPQYQTYQSYVPQLSPQLAHVAPPPPPPPPPPAPPLLPSPSVPPAPPLPESFSSINNYRSQKASNVDASYNKPNENSNQVVPDALLSKVINRSPAGQKPFSYTPGGLDLSHVRESARVKRYDSMNANSNSDAHFVPQNRQFNMSSSNETHQLQSHQSQYNQFQSQSSQQQMQSYHQPISVMTTSTPEPPPPPPPPVPQAQNSYGGSSSVSIITRASSVGKDTVSATRKPTGYQPSNAFNLTPEQLNKPKKNEERKDLMNQSFSFRMLNRWISESESNGVQLVSKKDEEEQSQIPTTLKKSEVIKALEEDEKTVRGRLSQSPQSNQGKFNPSYTVPSKVFQYVDRKFSESESSVVNRKASFSEEPIIFNPRVPARERDQEPALPKYKGTNIPSKSFRYLQYLTQNESVNDNSINNNNIDKSNPTQKLASASNQAAEPIVFQPATVQVATSNRPSTTSNQNLEIENNLLVNNQNILHSNNIIEQQHTQSVKSLIQSSTFNRSENFNASSNSVSFPTSATESNPSAITFAASTSNASTNSSSFSANLGTSSVAHVASATSTSIMSNIDSFVESTANDLNANAKSNSDLSASNIEIINSVIEEIKNNKVEPVVELNTNDESATVAEPIANEDIASIPPSSTITISNSEIINTDINLITQTVIEEKTSSSMSKKSELIDGNKILTNEEHIQKNESNQVYVTNQGDIQKSSNKQEVNVQNQTISDLNSKNSTSIVDAQEEIIETSEF